MNTQALHDSVGLPPDALATLAAVARDIFDAPVEITGLRRLTGGTSHDCWAFDALASGVAHPLLLRREFGNNALDVSLETECGLLLCLGEAGLPVPRLLAQGQAGSGIGTAFAVIERLPEGDLRKRLSSGALDRPALGRRVAAIQAEFHAYDWKKLPKDFIDRHGQENAAQRVETWSQIALESLSCSDILLVAAIEWLRRRVPADERLCLVHGDFKANNIVGDGADRLAVIDWELAHLGDPLEDLAWTMLWTSRFDIVGGMLPPEDYLQAYAAVTGASIDHERLAFWRLFALVKLAAIFVKSATLEGGDGILRPTHVMLLRAMPWIHRQIADLLLSDPTRLRAAS